MCWGIRPEEKEVWKVKDINVSKTEGSALISECKANLEFYLKMYILREEKSIFCCKNKWDCFPSDLLIQCDKWDCVIILRRFWQMPNVATTNKIKSKQHERYFFREDFKQNKHFIKVKNCKCSPLPQLIAKARFDC